jgi:SsrA-binding protein
MAKKQKGPRTPVSGDVATNRRARHKFQVLETMEAGIELRGSEVKSLRDGKAQLNEAYAVVNDGEVWLRGAYIPPYLPASDQNHEPDRPRRLLLHRREIERLIGKTAERGLTLVPTRIYFKGPRAKVELALAKGKEGRDRRREIADRDLRREVERDFKQRLARKEGARAQGKRHCTRTRAPCNDWTHRCLLQSIQPRSPASSATTPARRTGSPARSS